MPEKVITLTRHIAEEQTLHSQATGELTRLLWDLALAFRLINREVNKAGLAEVLGYTNSRNVHGERVARLDTYAHSRILSCMESGGHLCIMASEEDPDPIQIPKKYEQGKYVLIFDPLDGSSNIDANVSIGTIFSIHRRLTKGEEGHTRDLLQPGHSQVAAGYTIFGSSTMLVYSAGNGVHGFTHDPSLGEFLLSHPDMRIPERGRYYSVNEGNARYFDAPTRAYLEWLKEDDPDSDRPYGLRYIGSMVADVHRTLLYGGVFLYPEVKKYRDLPPKPKLRLLYEAAPLAFICEQAGGRATTGTRRILDLQPTELHEKVPLCIGSPFEVSTYERLCREHAAEPPAEPATAASSSS